VMLTVGTGNATGSSAAVIQNGSGTVSFTKVGTGAQTLVGNNTYTGTTTVSGGTLALSKAFTTGTGFSVADGATGQLNNNGSGTVVLKTPTLVTNTTGKLDVGTNKAVITSPGTAGSWSGTAYTGTLGQAQTGRNGGAWNGPGINTSSSTPVRGVESFAVGVALNSDLGVGKSYANFGGVPVSGTDVLVRFTRTGDANLDGNIDGDDYFKIDSNVGNVATASWLKGDFDYNGRIDGDDYFLIDANYGRQVNPLVPVPGSGILAGSSASPLAGVTAVPEPSSIGLIAAAAIGTLRRRRRRSN